MTGLAGLSWSEAGEQAAAGALLAIPVGSTEQHGPHLPLSTDTDIAVALTTRLAAARPGVLVAPPVAYGSSGEHQDFPGTLSIGQETLELLLVELCRSASLTFARSCRCPRTAATPGRSASCFRNCRRPASAR